MYQGNLFEKQGSDMGDQGTVCEEILGLRGRIEHCPVIQK